MEKLKLLFTALLLLCCVGMAKAHDFEADGIYYNISSSTNKTVEVTYKGTYYHSYNEYTDCVVIPESVTYDGTTYCVTSIESSAFSDCDGLISITIPNSVTSIGNLAFSWCYGLTSVEIPNSVTSIGSSAFYYCDGLTSITIPNSVTSIGDEVFGMCTGLTSITIPNSVTSIGSYAFYYCTGLTSITIPNSVTSIEKSAFEYCTGLTSITIPNSVTSIGVAVFNGCSGLTSITIPNSVTSIGGGAFCDCTRLTSITIPNSITSIGESAFYNCTGLTSITIPNSVTSIGKWAFEGCTGLTNVTIGSSVTLIGSNAFAKCDNLTDVYCLATSVPSASSNTFNESYPEYMTLHVPEEAIDSYKTTEPWSSFGTIVTLNGETPEIPETPKCANPVITYSDGKLLFECETEGAEFITDVTCSDIKKFYDSEIAFSATYNICVYATATGYENSDIVKATLCWVECECEGDDTGIINIPAKAVLVTSSNGSISISCSLDGESVSVYTTSGTLIATTTIENGTTTVATGLSKGSVAIVKIADKSIKVAVN